MNIGLDSLLHSSQRNNYLIFISHSQLLIKNIQKKSLKSVHRDESLEVFNEKDIKNLFHKYWLNC